MSWWYPKCKFLITPWDNKCNKYNNRKDILPQKLFKPIRKRRVIHGYGEPFNVNVQVYALEEIIAEKLRTILQHVEKLQKRGWSRSIVRDYYDLWRVLGTFREEMDLSNFSALLRDKCTVRSVTFRGPQDFFPQSLLAVIEKTWEQWLGPLLSELPPFKTVIGELRPQIESLIPIHS